MILYFDSSHLDMILDAAIVAYPQECCGLLLGTIAGDDRYCQKVWPTVNAWTPDLAAEFGLIEASDEAVFEHSRADRYWINPRDLLHAQKWARQAGYQVLGVYHSHPNHTAMPSERDRRWAWAEYVYWIVSLRPQTSGAVVKLPDRSPHCPSKSGWELDYGGWQLHSHPQNGQNENAQSQFEAVSWQIGGFCHATPENPTLDD